MFKAFEKDVKSKTSEVEKYISIKNKIDCVFLFIPTDNVYFDIQSHHRDIISTAAQKNIYFCSPTTLIALITVFFSNARKANNEKNISRDLETLKILLEQFFK
jgi:DNA recombination protein RmuC